MLIGQLVFRFTVNKYRSIRNGKRKLLHTDRKNHVLRTCLSLSNCLWDLHSLGKRALKVYGTAIFPSVFGLTIAQTATLYELLMKIWLIFTYNDKLH